MDIQVNGKRVHAATGSRLINKEEPAVILLHGAGMDRTIWQLQTRNIAYMGRQAYALDLPGHGRSEGAPLITISEISEWVSDFMDAAELASASVIGHSMGALVAIEFAGNHPKKLNKLCLMGISEAMPLAPELIVFWGVGGKAQIGGHPHPGLWVHGASQTLIELSRPGVLFNDLVACDTYQGALTAAQKVQCDTRFILGKDDKMTPAKKSKPLVDAIKKSDVKFIEHCGHMMMTERPNLVYKAIAGFI